MRNWRILSRGYGLDIPEEELEPVAKSLDAVEAELRPLTKKIPLETEPAYSLIRMPEKPR